MSYFPAFLKLDNKKILIVGGGKIAHEKLERLLDFTQDIALISPKFSDSIMQSIEKNSLLYTEKKYNKGDIKGFAIVIVATNDIELQKEIFKESKKYNCLCNAVDSVEYCDFIFPSYLKKDNLTIAISTSGTSPALAKHLKIYLQRLIPQNISHFLAQMKELRESLPKGEKRMKMLDAKAKEYIDKL